ncbi:MAG: winged helix-turn-helix domain-containing protein [Rubrivivax sp.]|nr:winged helix-turn-helix domain-containing protein [Rubrivivax sp.]
MLGVGPFELSPDARELRRDGQPQALRRSAFEILLALAERPGQVLSKRLLCERAWPGREVSENSLQVEISALRKLLGSGAIATASGRGYQLTLPVQERGAEALPLLGRDDDLAALQALLAEGGVVSLVGEGGVGKTWLAQAVVRAQAQSAPAVMVALDGVHGAEAVRLAVAQALDLAPAASLASLTTRRGLLVLDGCDGALQAVANLLAEVQAQGAVVKLLTTSREALRVPGEHRFPVLPLAPEAARALFLCHAPAPVPTTLYQNLAGHPLAIVLAAKAPASGPPRHRSLMACFELSWAALSTAERVLLAQLAALPQPFDQGDVQALAADASPWDQIETLAGLVDKSLLLLEGREGGGPPTYQLGTLSRLCLQQRLAAQS